MGFTTVKVGKLHEAAVKLGNRTTLRQLEYRSLLPVQSNLQYSECHCIINNNQEEQTMKKFVGSKIIHASPMNRLEYNVYRGWQLPENENGTDEGFLVEYLDGGEANDPNHAGYISWSPKAVFENAYRESGKMTFGDALLMLEQGKKVSRSGWNGKGMFLFLVQGSTFTVNRAPLLGIYPEGTEINYHAHVDMRTATGEIVPWLCSQTDMLAKDWCIVE